MFHSFDASRPPMAPPPNCDAVLGYLGGATPHTWTDDEWRRFGHLRQMGIWVADFAAPARVQGVRAVTEATRLGWTPHALTPRGIACDMETSTDADWLAEFGRQVNAGGFACLPYGSASTITRVPSFQGRWTALYDDVQDLTTVHQSVGHQYLAGQPFGGTRIDLSVWDSQAWHRFGYGARK